MFLRNLVKKKSFRETFFRVFIVKIGERIKKVRKMAGQSQLVFAEELGVDRSHISNIERGNREPSSQLIKLICSFYGINENWLRKNEGPVLWDNSVSPKEFIKIIKNFEEEGQKGLCNILDTYTYTLLKFTAQVYEYDLSKLKFDNPKPETLSSIENLKDALEHFKRALDVWFEALFKKK